MGSALGAFKKIIIALGTIFLTLIVGLFALTPFRNWYADYLAIPAGPDGEQTIMNLMLYEVGFLIIVGFLAGLYLIRRFK